MTKNPTALLNIGAQPATVEKVGAIILKILASPVADATQIEALHTLTATCEVKNVNIEGCTFTGAAATKRG